MKKLAMVLLVVIGLFSQVAMADGKKESPASYVGFGITNFGYDHLSKTPEEKYYLENSATYQTKRVEGSGNGLDIFVGHKFAQYHGYKEGDFWAVEVGYMKGPVGPEATTSGVVSGSNFSINRKSKISKLQVSIIGEVTLYPEQGGGFFGRVGVARTNLDYRTVTTTGTSTSPVVVSSESRNSIVLGLGGCMYFMKNAGLRLEMINDGKHRADPNLSVLYLF